MRWRPAHVQYTTNKCAATENAKSHCKCTASNKCAATETHRGLHGKHRICSRRLCTMACHDDYNQKKRKRMCKGYGDFLLRTPISTQTSTVVSGSWTVALPRKGGGKTWMHSLEENGLPSKLPKYLSFFCERNLMPPADSECWGKGASLEDVALSENSWPVDGTVRLSLGGSSVAPSEKHSCAALIL